MTQVLDQRVIVVIGGTTGLGLSGARACVAAGARVVVVGRQSETCSLAQQSLGSVSRALQGDARFPETAEQAIQLALQEFGRFDGLYHVAGGSGRRLGDGPLDTISDEGWEFTLGLNLSSVFCSNRAAVRQFLRDGRGGAVLNMTSVLAFSPSPGYFATHAYAAAKAGILGLTRSAAAYYAPKNIRFNAIAPALVETPMSQRALGDQVTMNYIAGKQPLDGGRVGQPQDLDAAVVYFLSDASRFVTGQILAVDGGWSVS